MTVCVVPTLLLVQVTVPPGATETFWGVKAKLVMLTAALAGWPFATATDPFIFVQP